jgi:hypothetical protein
MPCGHLFKSDALIDWFKRESTCPVCRKALPIVVPPPTVPFPFAPPPGAHGAPGAEESWTTWLGGWTDRFPWTHTVSRFSTLFVGVSLLMQFALALHDTYTGVGGSQQLPDHYPTDLPTDIPTDISGGYPLGSVAFGGYLGSLSAALIAPLDILTAPLDISLGEMIRRSTDAAMAPGELSTKFSTGSGNDCYYYYHYANCYYDYCYDYDFDYDYYYRVARATTTRWGLGEDIEPSTEEIVPSGSDTDYQYYYRLAPSAEEIVPSAEEIAHGLQQQVLADEPSTLLHLSQVAVWTRLLEAVASILLLALVAVLVMGVVSLAITAAATHFGILRRCIIHCTYYTVLTPYLHRTYTVHTTQGWYSGCSGRSGRRRSGWAGLHAQWGGGRGGDGGDAGEP